ncbi:GNAT family N-acetyltransferase [Mycoplana dimorpha]|uniref:Acetyltransferase (GNAT) family protein n=1 Tax=Mycoplana dimorpha TaxID=28320 RepID=A0A2T5BEW8_MYCDI|nr:GNAT family N-acetyltransferase [Mycoplana dimorpha]PTM97488.1 acetyltransferase (GNAT) family protein [Mycoplana dimorpha]
MSDRSGLVYREDFLGDPAAWAALKDLLEDVFGIDLGPLDRLGGPDPSSLPSAYFDAAGRCVANFTAFSMPLLINGRTVKAAGLQSGAVRTDYRGRGLFRDLVRRTVERCDALGFEAVALYTDKPALYEPHGFEVVPQHRFSGPAPIVPTGSSPSMRRLDLHDAADLALLQRLLRARSPVSQHFAVCGQATMFLINALFLDDLTLSYLPAQDAVIAWRAADNGPFELLDVVAAEVPSLVTILQALGVRPERVEAAFPPDRLDWKGEAVAETVDLQFMVRGKTGLMPSRPGRLSPMAEF